MKLESKMLSQYGSMSNEHVLGGLQNECWPISDTLSSFPINGFAKAVWHLQTATEYKAEVHNFWESGYFTSFMGNVSPTQKAIFDGKRHLMI